MRLALITQDFAPKIGGIQTYSLELAKRFQKECDFFCVIAPKVKGHSEIDLKIPLKIKRIKSSESLLGWIGLLELPNYIRKYRIDSLFHTQWTTLPVSVFLKKAGIIDQIYLAAHGRELLFNPFPKESLLAKAYKWYRNTILKKVDYFFPVSDYTANLLEEVGVDSQKVKVVINGTDPDLFYPLLDNTLKKELEVEEKKVILTITRLVSRKGIDTVLKTLPNIIKKYPNLIYLIVGQGGYKRELEKLIDELNINEYVRFVGKIPYDQLIKYYNVCDIFVMPSITELPDVEGFGLVFLEANACKKPVIGSKSGGIPSAIVQNETGLMVNEQSPKELEEALLKLLDNPELCALMGEKGRERVKEKANWDFAAKEIIAKMLELKKE